MHWSSFVRKSLALSFALTVLALVSTAPAANQFWNTNGTSSTWTSANWGSSSTGPFTTGWTGNNDANFTATSAITYVTLTNVGNINVTGGSTVTLTPAGTFTTGSNVRTFDVGAGSILDFGSQSIQTNAATGIIKNGAGIFFSSNGNGYTGGFTLNAGTMIAGGTVSMGTGALTINGGTLAANASRTFTGRFTSFTIGGDFTFGAVTAGVGSGNGSSSANISIDTNANMGAATRTITIGSNASYVLQGVVSGNSGTGLTVTASGGATGFLDLFNSNTYTGATTLNGGVLEIKVLANGGSNSGIGASSNAAANLVLNGGNLSYIGTASGSTDRNMTLGANGGTLTASGTIPNFLATAANAANGTVTYSGNVTPSGSSGSQTLTLAGTNGTNLGNGTMSGVISNGTGTNTTALTKTGNGSWTLSGSSANTYSGLTTVSQGTLNLNKTAGTNAIAGDGNTGTTDVSVTSGTLKWLASNQIANDVTINQSGGTVDLNGQSETINAFTNSGGTFQTGVNGHLIGTGNTTTWSGGTNTINDGGSVEDTNIVITGGTNTVQGGGTGGTLKVVTGGTGLEMTGSTLTLNSNATVAGKLLVDGDVLVHGSTATATIQNGGTAANAGNVDLDGGTRNFNVDSTDTLSVSAVITNGGVTKTGAGNMTVSASNTYTGGTNVNAGTFTLGSSNVLADSGAVTVGGGTLDIGANSDTVGTVTLTSGNINGSGGTLTGSSYGVQSGSISANLGGSGALTKTTAGTVILTGANSYSGGTNVNAGTLALNANNVLPTTGTVSMGGGTLQLNSSQQGTTATPGAGPMSLASSSIIDLASTDLLHFAASGGQSWSGTLSIYNWNGTPVTGGGAEQILFGTDTTSASLTAAQLASINFYSDSGTTFLGTAAFATANNGEIVPTVSEVPEPGTWAAGALVTATLLAMQRRRLSRILIRA